MARKFSFMAAIMVGAIGLAGCVNNTPIAMNYSERAAVEQPGGFGLLGQ